MITIPEAIDVFVHAFCRGKSRTYPYVPTYADGLWIMQDTPPRKNPRKIEVITHGLEPEQAAEIIAREGLGWHFLCEIHQPEDDFDAIRAKYKSLGYKAVSTEWLFVHSLRDIPVFESDPPVRLVPDPETLATIKTRRVRPHRLRPGVRKYIIWDEDTDYGWVNSVPFGDNNWVADLYVHESERGKGYGRALMSKLLQDDRDAGVKNSVLLATSSGARLYPYMGYEKIGILQMFCPAKR